MFVEDLSPVIDALNFLNPVIAQLLGVNLKTIAQNTIPFLPTVTASNSAPRRVLIVPKSGTYNGTGIEEVLATASFKVNNNTLTDLDSILVKETTTDTELGTFVFNTGDSVNDIVEGIAASIGSGYVGAANITTDNVTITAPVGTGATANNFVIALYGRGENDPGFTPIADFAPTLITLNDSGEFSGGVTASPSAYSLKLNGDEFTIQGGTLVAAVSQLVVETNIINSSLLNSAGSPVFASTGNYVLSVTEGTNADFIIDILVLGDKIQ